MKHYLFIILFILFISQTIIAQETEYVELIGDRPDQTESSVVLPKGYMQIEDGFVNESVNTYQTNISYSSFLIRYGLLENLELRFASDYQKSKQKGIKDIDGFAPVSLGTKIQVSQESGWVPQIAFLGHITLANTGSSEYMQQYHSANMVITCSHTIKKNWSVGYSLGVEFPSEIDYTIGTYTFVSGFSITEKIGAFIEFYGDFSKYMYADNKMNGGITYLVHPKLQLDFAGGFGLSQYSANNYYSIGLIYLFKLR